NRSCADELAALPRRSADLSVASSQTVQPLPDRPDVRPRRPPSTEGAAASDLRLSFGPYPARDDADRQFHPDSGGVGHSGPHTARVLERRTAGAPPGVGLADHAVAEGQHEEDAALRADPASEAHRPDVRTPPDGPEGPRQMRVGQISTR